MPAVNWNMRSGFLHPISLYSPHHFCTIARGKPPWTPSNNYVEHPNVHDFKGETPLDPTPPSARPHVPNRYAVNIPREETPLEPPSSSGKPRSLSELRVVAYGAFSLI